MTNFVSPPPSPTLPTPLSPPPNPQSGMFMEDTEQSTVSDVGGLAERLESALKKAGASSEEADLTEEEKAAKIAELDDGW